VKPAPSTDYPYKWAPDGTPLERPSDDQLPRPQPPGKKAAWLALIEWGVLIVSALLIALLIKTFLFQAFYIPSESMTPTLKIHDRVLVNKLSYKLHPVHRGDIVVFKAPPHADPGIDDLVKRVVGLPGDTVSAHGGHVYIDGKRLPRSTCPSGSRRRRSVPSRSRPTSTG